MSLSPKAVSQRGKKSFLKMHTIKLQKVFLRTLKNMFIALLCPVLCDPIDCSPLGSCTHGILQAWILEWVAILFSGESSRPEHRTPVFCIAGRFFTVWVTREAHERDIFDQKLESGVGSHWRLWVKFWVYQLSTTDNLLLLRNIHPLALGGWAAGIPDIGCL